MPSRIIACAAVYADPGSGALLWQLLLSFFVGFLFYYRRFTDWVTSKTRKRERSHAASDKG